ncbi:MAG: hypothetical protein LBL00_01420 [Endomicrobium sp.]|jgi:hypothetical protein|nr:hypothetical protein [Endomicrobium sp.]
MKEKNKKKPDNKTFKTVLVITAVFVLLNALVMGLFVYISYATDEEISSYSAYLEKNMDLKQREAEKYEDIIPQEIKEMEKEIRKEMQTEIKEVRFGNDALQKYNKFLPKYAKMQLYSANESDKELKILNASIKYYELSKNVKAARGDKNLIDAYMAYGDYYYALYSKASFEMYIKSPNVVSKIVSKIFFAKSKIK